MERWKYQPVQLGYRPTSYKWIMFDTNVSVTKMWPWELNPQELSTLESELYQGPHLFTALYHFYKASFWGVGIHIGPNHPIYPKGFLANFLNLPIHLQEKILKKIWNNGEGFNEIIIIIMCLFISRFDPIPTGFLSVLARSFHVAASAPEPGHSRWWPQLT